MYKFLTDTYSALKISQLLKHALAGIVNNFYLILILFVECFMFSFVNSPAAIYLAQVLLELAIDGDEFLGDDFVLLVCVLNLALEIVVACFFEACQSSDILREALIDLFCLLVCYFESAFQILERIRLNSEETIGLWVALHRLKPFFQVWLAFNLSITVKRCNLVRNSRYHLLFEVLRYLRGVFIVKTCSETI